MRTIKAIAFLAAFTGLFSAPAFAQLNVELNASKLQIDNQPGEKIVLIRTEASPKKIKIDLNPTTKYKTVCVEYDYQNRCGYNAFQCGTNAVYQCNSHGQCWWTEYPRYCCWMEQYCRRYENVPYTAYGDITLKFKADALAPGQTEEFELIPLSMDEAEIKVLKSVKPYRIKVNGDRDSFELRQ